MPDLFLELKGGDGESQRQAPLTEAEALHVLTTADFSGAQLIPWGSNYTFAVVLEPDDDHSVLAIYKPRAGEATIPCLASRFRASLAASAVTPRALCASLELNW